MTTGMVQDMVTLEESPVTSLIWSTSLHMM